MNQSIPTLVPLGLKEGRLFFVDEVVSGLACDCFCPSCEAPLVARNRKRAGRLRRPHFSHYRKGKCLGAFESVIHRMAKEVLLSGHVTLPGLYFDKPIKHRADIISAAAEVLAPGLLRKRQPDVLAEVSIDGRHFQLMIEVRYRHDVDEEKQAEYRDSGLACIELDVRDIPMNVFAERADFEKRVRDGARYGRWVSLSGTAVHALLQCTPVRVEDATVKEREVPYRSKRGESMAWLVKVQLALRLIGAQWEPVALELEECIRNDVWCDGDGVTLPYRQGWYVQVPAQRFKQRLSPLHVDWLFPGEQTDLLASV